MAVVLAAPVGATVPAVGANVGTTVGTTVELAVELPVLNNIRRCVLLLPEVSDTYTLGAKLGELVLDLKCRGEGAHGEGSIHDRWWAVDEL